MLTLIDDDGTNRRSLQQKITTPLLTQRLSLTARRPQTDRAGDPRYSRLMRQRALVLSLLTLCSVASADDAGAARRHFQAGSSLFDLGKFREAAAEYEEAYKAKNDPALLFNIGQAYRAANEPAPAITAYKSFLRHVPDAPNRPLVEGFILRLQKQLDDEALKQQQKQEPAPVVVQPETQPPVAPEKPPLYKRPWLWAAVGGAVVVGVAVGVGVAYGVPKDAPAPPNALTVSF
jgi:tetratricopeptide (TPR) repeat protein